jgi:hypothetical protein
LQGGFRFPRCFLLEAESFKPLYSLPPRLGSQFISWPLACTITRRSDQRQYRGLAEGFAGLETVQPVEKNVPVLILIGADQYWDLLARLKNALSDALHRLGINGLSPFHRDMNSVD